MPDPKPLTHDDLHAIRRRYEVTPERAPCMFDGRAVERDMTLLLAEVDRLREMVQRARDLHDRFPRPGSCLDSIWGEFQRDLDAEPRRPSYLEIPKVLGCSMVEPFVGPPERWQVRAAQVGAARQKPRRR